MQYYMQRKMLEAEAGCACLADIMHTLVVAKSLEPDDDNQMF